MLVTAIGQPASIPGSCPDIARLVVQDIELRAAGGEVKYGTRLQPFNGRDALIDLYQELLDAALYLRQRIAEEHLRAEGFAQDFDGAGIA